MTWISFNMSTRLLSHRALRSKTRRRLCSRARHGFGFVFGVEGKSRAKTSCAGDSACEIP